MCSERKMCRSVEGGGECQMTCEEASAAQRCILGSKAVQPLAYLYTSHWVLENEKKFSEVKTGSSPSLLLQVISLSLLPPTDRKLFLLAPVNLFSVSQPHTAASLLHGLGQPQKSCMRSNQNPIFISSPAEPAAKPKRQSNPHSS